jgi:hypothetical protein
MDSPPPKKRRQRECQQYRLEFCFVGPASQYSTLWGSFERRHAGQRIGEEPSREVARLEFGSAITLRQR